MGKKVITRELGVGMANGQEDNLDSNHINICTYGVLKMKLSKILYILIISTLLSGCIYPLATIPNTNQKTQTPTYLSEPSKPSATETTIAPPKIKFEIQPFCPEVNLNSSQFSELTGTIVLSGENILLTGKVFSPDNGQKSILLYWDPNTGEKIENQLAEDQKYFYFVTSPDKKRLAFTEGKTLPKTSEVVVLNNRGEESGNFVLPDDWTLFSWLNNEQLLARQQRLLGENIGLISINPLTGEQVSLPSDFPNIYTKEPFISWGAITIFNPTLSLVVYPELKGNELSSVIWDVKRGKEIDKVVDGNFPRWSPDGNQLMITVKYEPKLHELHDEIFLVRMNGDLIRYTYFKEYFENDNINLPVWSPDGRYIAFWLSDAIPVKSAKLAILDTETSIVQLYCEEFDPFPFRFGEDITLGYSDIQVNAAPPIWSPDSHYLLIEDYQNFASNTYIFDLQNHAITQIAENARPVSWMK